MYALLRHIFLVYNGRDISDWMGSSQLYLIPGLIKEQTRTPGLKTLCVLKLKKKKGKNNKIKGSLWRIGLIYVCNINEKRGYEFEREKEGNIWEGLRRGKARENCN